MLGIPTSPTLKLAYPLGKPEGLNLGGKQAKVSQPTLQ